MRTGSQPTSIAIATLAALTAGTAQAQDASAETIGEDGAREHERRVILALVPEDGSDELGEEFCDRLFDEAVIAGEIVVCRNRPDQASDGVWDEEDWERRYAARTQGPKPVDVAGSGIFHGPASVGGLCLLNPCPDEPAYMIDFAELPEAPPGSDADRIARGLPPLEQ